MKLKFLGRGAAFNPKQGNNTAYFIENNELFLIDCGSTAFYKIMKIDLLKNIEKINVFITHTHTDHIGSLGTLIEYAFFIMHQKVNLILDYNLKHTKSIKQILELTGITREMYNITYPENLNNYETFNKVNYIETYHTDKLPSYNIIFETNNGIVFYSGDTNNMEYLKYLINQNIEIDKIYIETTLDSKSPVHLPISKLMTHIPENLVSKVYCMHLESEECMTVALEQGFNVVEVEKTKIKRLLKNNLQ